MRPLTEQLKKYLETATRDQLEEDFFKIECKLHDIDSTAPNAKRKLAWAKFKIKFSLFWPKVQLIGRSICSAVWFMCLGACIVHKLWAMSVWAFFWGVFFICLTIQKAKKL